ncbi:DUF2970 domain-containing protein [Alkalimarinus alittae]|uniref:DUF2970 domain-containing protein n=1 Tax=Alkalimarinus alittae TaxID=2961619 RepID=A0ABY6N2S2_9ALTE|nr:DUF2970 domain-containing protein [Alkalimarinus alittae]UZE96292.1 DUF2970 domain-containing protein [Alkalimarinus alittae]
MMNNPDNTPSPNTSDTTQPKTKLTFWQTLSSVLYALIGVQGRNNAQSSLEEGHIGMFIFVGLLVVGCFIFIVSLVAYLAVSSG